ncbi:MAG: hypothetical protein HY290_31260 [Planctomycetia bacterium]|nr:hypothetical protein [Planctomycetia bacterium]
MSVENSTPPAGQPFSRREMLVSASQGGIALGALSAVAGAAGSVQAAQKGEKPAERPADAKIIDFERSCLRFRLDTTKKPPKTVSRKLPMTLNNVRMLLDARAVITHKKTGRVNDYVLSSSCKSEQVWVERDVWHQPNADMCMLAGPDEFLVFKRWDKADKGVMLFPATLGVQPERQLDDPRECFDSFSINLVTRPGRVLENIDTIIAALSAATPVISQTEYETPHYRVLLEYPVRVVNFSERERFYQVDTGPVLLPDLDGEYKSLLEGCRLAYVAHNSPGWAEFIVCARTPLADGISVHHYSQSVRIEGTRNRLIASV